ncbi:MAG: oxygen-independent coproporphyrinogen III oxidase [Helicobacter sp.]|uniref:oxygen-independent coproporphyrinogen III oxidase n=1 Tax=Helicobacter sp. 10-6591 TaxID=2004998 RepID=UPI000DCC9828|nr:oxygen-independent coproporphyrinogen III oxidase [Helicobacter sp. 10-6591]MCI6217615.1 oxygen-independent coproporphyrinogen III oxidase [Helicobacter sp.]MCI7485637.1 oxygen-independent coproporphyrinogen III oxidase [Helicobacter sp.]RAX56024.1 oxygen-independent coproporphyrinogen III oxidase [Helicobacter sp. 10-6591]
MIDFDKYAKYSKPGPRYTSYPTAVEFGSDFTEDSYKKALKRSEIAQQKLPLSLYIHLPFCRSACYFCGCNVIYTSKEEKKARYIQYLKKELALLKESIDTKRPVVQFHFGGGTPTFFNAQELQSVCELVQAVFTNFTADCEISCEVDPRYFSYKQMQVLKSFGFNRLSFGVQDFEAQVQAAINRKQSFEIVQSAVNLARDFGISSINFDLIFGLPFQNRKSFQRTLDSVLKLEPSRLAIFNYAHVPWLKKTMRKIDGSTLPPPQEKLHILQESITKLASNGYEMIGMDHFAKKDDELYKAKITNSLRRNFQGYTTKGFSQTIGIGVTSISEGLDYYAQNFKELSLYESALDSGLLPTERGVELSKDDRLRKGVIMELMNNLRLDFAKFEYEFGICFHEYFADELDNLKPFVDVGLVQKDKTGLSTSPTGAMLIRNIAMLFDSYLHKNRGKETFSKTI